MFKTGFFSSRYQVENSGEDFIIGADGFLHIHGFTHESYKKKRDNFESNKAEIIEPDAHLFINVNVLVEIVQHACKHMQSVKDIDFSLDEEMARKMINKLIN